MSKEKIKSGHLMQIQMLSVQLFGIMIQGQILKRNLPSGNTTLLNP